MRLKQISYSQFEGRPRDWRLDQLLLGSLNLLVGRNASGKSKTISVIHALALLLTGQSKPAYQSGRYDATFENDGKVYQYLLRYENKVVKFESLKIDDELLLERGEEGLGTIVSNQFKEPIKFQISDTELAVVKKRDLIQHPFLEPLYDWGNTTYLYHFGSNLGRDRLAGTRIESGELPDIDPHDTNAPLLAFKHGAKEFGPKFIEAIKQDMAQMGYQIETIGVAKPISIEIQGAELVGLYVKEADLNEVTDQADISQGMFRSLALIIQFNYSLMVFRPSCILIDDIGEGLDYERSCALIDVLVEKTKQSNLQLIMSTNDRFVMNRVPLEAWTILKRIPPKVECYNYHNSKAVFEDFKFTGMSNFDFFATDFIKDTSYRNS